MPAQWSPKRWPKKVDPSIVIPAPPPCPPPPALMEKWMARFDNKQFYFTAMGLEAADRKAASFFRVIRYASEITWLGVVPLC